MRRKTFDVLFETRDGMRLLVQERCMWRSLWYFALSVGLFSGVVTNQLFLDQTLSVRFAVIAAAVSIAGVVLSMYGFLLHGILETLGAMAGDACGIDLSAGLYDFTVSGHDSGSFAGNKTGPAGDAGSSGGLYYSEAVDAVPADQSLTGGLPDRF